MGNLILASAHTWSDLATLTASQALSTTPGTNLQTMQPTDLWQSTNLTSVSLELDAGSALPFTLVALLYSNLTLAATWRIRSADTQGNLTAAPDYDSGSVTAVAVGADTTWPRRHAVLWLDAAAETNRWVRIDLTDASNPDGFFRAGRLIVANAWQPSHNMQLPRSFGYLDASPRRKTLGQQTIVRRLARQRVDDLELGYLTEAEVLADAFELDRLRGSSEDVLLITNPDEATYLHQKLCYGLLTTELIRQASFRDYRYRVRVEELL
jgi:hypothetical protein